MAKTRSAPSIGHFLTFQDATVAAAFEVFEVGHGAKDPVEGKERHGEKAERCPDQVSEHGARLAQTKPAHRHDDWTGHDPGDGGAAG